MSYNEGDSAFLDSALGGVTMDDLEFVMEQLEERPAGHPRGRIAEHAGAMQQTDTAASCNHERTVISHSNEAHRLNPNQIPSAYLRANTGHGHGLDDARRRTCNNGSSFLSTTSHMADKLCRACSSSKIVTLSYGELLCINCNKFMKKVIKRGIHVQCCQSDCCTTYRPGRKIKCVSCRVKSLSKLNINHPDWIQYKNTNMTLAVSEHAGAPVKVLSRPSQGPCRICGNTKNVRPSSKFDGLICCGNCFAFLKSSLRRKFKFHCGNGLFRCELRHTGLKSKENPGMCRGCRLKRAIESGFRHPLIMESAYKQFLPGAINDRIASPPTVQGPSSAPMISHIKSCAICDNRGRLFRRREGFLYCINCQQFLKNAHKKEGFPFRCITGQYNCKPTKGMCSGCRARRALDLGYKRPNLAHTDPYSQDSNIRTKDGDAVSSSKPIKSPEATGQPVISHHAPVASVQEPLQLSNTYLISTPGSSKQQPTERSCQICGNKRYLKKLPEGFICCSNCSWFLKTCPRKANFPAFPCSGGLYKCNLQFESYGPHTCKPLCKACRMHRAIDLGYKFYNSNCQPVRSSTSASASRGIEGQTGSCSVPITSGLTSHQDLLVTDDGNHNELRSLEEVPEPRENSTSPLSSRSVEAVNGDERLKPENAQTKTIEIIDMSDLGVAPDEFGLPADVSYRFSRWLYADMDPFKPGSSGAKRAQDDVAPSGLFNVAVYRNDISDNKDRLLTEGLDPDDRPPLDEIISPSIRIRPSSSLLRANSSSKVGDPANLKLPKPKVTLTLETRRITIDRRPMLKKLRASIGSDPMNSDGISSTSLIGPGEDCDESGDEFEEMEID